MPPLVISPAPAVVARVCLRRQRRRLPLPPSPCKSACLPSLAPTPFPPLFPHGLGAATATSTMLRDHRPCSPHPSLHIVLLPLTTPLASLASFAGPTILASSFCLSLTPPIVEHRGEPRLPSSPLPPLLRLPRMPPPLLSTVAATVPLAPVRSRSGMAARLRVATRRNRHCAHTCPIQPPWSSSPSSPWQELSSRWAPGPLPARAALYTTLPPSGPPPWCPPSATLPAPQVPSPCGARRWTRRSRSWTRSWPGTRSRSTRPASVRSKRPSRPATSDSSSTSVCLYFVPFVTLVMDVSPHGSLPLFLFLIWFLTVLTMLQGLSGCKDIGVDHANFDLIFSAFSVLDDEAVMRKQLHEARE
jgi:hypothetical protein